MKRIALVTFTLLALALASPVPVVTQSANPCATALADVPFRATRTVADRASKLGWFGNDSRDVRDLLHLSSAARAQRRVRALSTASRPMADRDENNIAILEDNNGDLIIRPNSFDLASSGLRFEPADGGYSIARTSAEFRAPLGRAVTLEDDDSSAATIPFSFEFFGRRFTSLFINSDGNLTFEEGDNASTERGISRLTAGAPRIAPFFADLDPSAAGRVFLDSSPDALSVTWCAVPGFGLPETMTAQATLLPSGEIEFRFGDPTLRDGIVALSPGRTEMFDARDLSTSTPSSSHSSALGEQFIASPSLDLVAASQRFYATHPDNFDQLVFWTDVGVMTDAFAFNAPVKNAIAGIGQEQMDFSAELGSAGSLQSVLNMDRVAKYGESPTSREFGGLSPLGILAHETGHRWLARLQFHDADRERSAALLGRQRSHWSFFMDSDGSVMEGNEIEELGGGQFRAGSAAEKFSRLDLYAMGLATPDEVPAWFYIDSPISIHDREDGPAPGATITGTRRDVLIQDVIDAMGVRTPASADSPRLVRQAFIYVMRSDTSAQLRQLDLRSLTRMREEFGAFFSRATENRMSVRTTLAP